MAVILALTAAATWGASDFLGGLTGRRVTHDISVSVSLASHVIGLIGLATVAAIVGGSAMTPVELGYASAAGLGGALGVAMLYRGLAVGRMGVVAPITGVGAAALPVIAGVVQGEQPPLLAWLGIVLALIAIVMVSREPAPAHDGAGPPSDGGYRGLSTPGVKEGILGGIGFGTIFVMLEQTPEAAGLWPLIPMKITSIVLLSIAGIVTSRELVPPRIVWPMVLGAGVFDNAANVAYLLATRRGLLSLVAVLSSLYPIVTILLARVVLDERLAKHQVAGLVLAGGAVALIAGTTA